MHGNRNLWMSLALTLRRIRLEAAGVEEPPLLPQAARLRAMAEAMTSARIFFFMCLISFS